VLSVLEAASVGHEDRGDERNLRVKDLVLVQVAKALVKAADRLGQIAPHEEASCARRVAIVANEMTEQRRRVEYSIGFDTQAPDDVPRPAVPTLPHYRRAAQHSGCGMRFHHRHLLLELPRQPDVIRIEECDILPSRVTHPEIARRARAEVPMALVLQVSDPALMRVRVLQGDRRAAVARAVIHQQQLPVGVRLGGYTLDRFAKELLPVEKRNDGGDQAVASGHRLVPAKDGEAAGSFAGRERVVQRRRGRTMPSIRPP